MEKFEFGEKVTLGCKWGVVVSVTFCEQRNAWMHRVAWFPDGGVSSKGFTYKQLEKKEEF